MTNVITSHLAVRAKLLALVCAWSLYWLIYVFLFKIAGCHFFKVVSWCLIFCSFHTKKQPNWLKEGGIFFPPAAGAEKLAVLKTSVSMGVFSFPQTKNHQLF